MTNDSTIKKLTIGMFSQLGVQIIWTILCSLIASMATFFISRHFKYSSLEIGEFITLIVFVISVVSVILYRKNNKRLPNFAAINCDFHMLKEERVHKWLQDEDYIHKRRYKLKALKDGLMSYTDKFQWTGKEYVLSGGNSDYRVEQDVNTKNVYDVYHFRFNSALIKDQEIDVEATWIAKGPAKPFFSTTIEEPTDLLVMSVMLYPGCGVTKVNCIIEAYKGARVPIKPEKQILNSDGEYSWKIDDPKILHHYEINWNR